MARVVAELFKSRESMENRRVIAKTENRPANDEFVEKSQQLRVDELIEFMERAAYNFAHVGNSNTANALFVAVAALEQNRSRESSGALSLAAGMN